MARRRRLGYAVPVMCNGMDIEASFEKSASWESVRAKGEAILANGGVEIYRNDAKEVAAYVMSGVVEGQFPVTDGGPYEVILSKRSWENRNTGGWVQGWLCDCVWGFYHSGAPGLAGRFSGRFCSHAYAVLMAANMRARKDFMGDRTASAEWRIDENEFGERIHVRDYGGGFIGVIEKRRYWHIEDPTGYWVNEGREGNLHDSEAACDFWAEYEGIKSASLRFDKDNFHDGTSALWFPCNAPEAEPDHVSESGSMYWFYPEGVVRCSDHWGSGIGGCDWAMLGDEHESSWDDPYGVRCGFCPWQNFEMNTEADTGKTAASLRAMDESMSDRTASFGCEWNSDNFYMGTEAWWEPCGEPVGAPDYVSASGSAYWYSTAGVVRCSDHWGRGVGSCNWFMSGDGEDSSFADGNGKRFGFCPWQGFDFNRELDFDVVVYDESLASRLLDSNMPNVKRFDAYGIDYPCAAVTPTPDMMRDGYIHIMDARVKFDAGSFMCIADCDVEKTISARDCWISPFDWVRAGIFDGRGIEAKMAGIWHIDDESGYKVHNYYGDNGWFANVIQDGFRDDFAVMVYDDGGHFVDGVDHLSEEDAKLLAQETVDNEGASIYSSSKMSGVNDPQYGHMYSVRTAGWSGRVVEVENRWAGEYVPAKGPSYSSGGEPPEYPEFEGGATIELSKDGTVMYRVYFVDPDDFDPDATDWQIEQEMQERADELAGAFDDFDEAPEHWPAEGGYEGIIRSFYDGSEYDWDKVAKAAQVYNYALIDDAVERILDIRKNQFKSWQSLPDIQGDEDVLNLFNQFRDMTQDDYDEACRRAWEEMFAEGFRKNALRNCVTWMQEAFEDDSQWWYGESENGKECAIELDFNAMELKFDLYYDGILIGDVYARETPDGEVTNLDEAKEQLNVYAFEDIEGVRFDRDYWGRPIVGFRKAAAHTLNFTTQGGSQVAEWDGEVVPETWGEFTDANLYMDSYEFADGEAEDDGICDEDGEVDPWALIDWIREQIDSGKFAMKTAKAAYTNIWGVESVDAYEVEERLYLNMGCEATLDDSDDASKFDDDEQIAFPYMGVHYLVSTRYKNWDVYFNCSCMVEEGRGFFQRSHEECFLLIDCRDEGVYERIDLGDAASSAFARMDRGGYGFWVSDADASGCTEALGYIIDSIGWVEMAAGFIADFINYKNIMSA